MLVQRDRQDPRVLRTRPARPSSRGARRRPRTRRARAELQQPGDRQRRVVVHAEPGGGARRRVVQPAREKFTARRASPRHTGLGGPHRPARSARHPRASRRRPGSSTRSRSPYAWSAADRIRGRGLDRLHVVLRGARAAARRVAGRLAATTSTSRSRPERHPPGPGSAPV